jgi:hypothetical protein
MMSKIRGDKNVDIIGGWRELHNEELHELRSIGRVLLKKREVSQLVKKFQAFMEPTSL